MKPNMKLSLSPNCMMVFIERSITRGVDWYTQRRKCACVVIPSWRRGHCRAARDAPSRLLYFFFVCPHCMFGRCFFGCVASFYFIPIQPHNRRCKKSQDAAPAPATTAKLSYLLLFSSLVRGECEKIDKRWRRFINIFRS